MPPKSNFSCDEHEEGNSSFAGKKLQIDSSDFQARKPCSLFGWALKEGLSLLLESNATRSGRSLLCLWRGATTIRLPFCYDLGSESRKIVHFFHIKN